MRAAALLLAAVVGTAAPAAAQRSLVIQRFDAAVDVARDGSIVVEEIIAAKFTGSWNGIYRTIPVEYRTPQGLNYTLRLDLRSVTDGDGTPLRYESSRERQYRKLKIYVPGAVDTTRTVKIQYSVSNALRFFDDHDELYWNITGDEWSVPIEAATAVMRLPDGVTGVRATAFRGAYGSTERNEVTVEGTTVRIVTGRLSFHEGLTGVIGWDPGVVRRPTLIERSGNVLYSNMGFLMPLLVFGWMFTIWRRHGRDPQLAPILTLYEPPDKLTPAELGTLADGTPDMRDVTATIVDLAVRGYLHIEETKVEHLLGLWSDQDYVFTLKKPRGEWTGLKTYERDLLDGLFETGDSVQLSDLKNKFYKKLPGLKNQLYDSLVENDFYKARPDRVRGRYLGYAVVLGGGVAWIGTGIAHALGMQPASVVIGGILAAVIMFLFGLAMPCRTIRGTRELEKIRGFSEFLSRVEGDRMERMIRTPEMFEKFLPYAMALGVESAWAKAFEGIYKQAPQWYTGPGGVHSFSPSSFTGSMSRLSSAAGSVMSSAPRGSGGSGFSGGSSGGGFGGGGGGGF